MTETSKLDRATQYGARAMWFRMPYAGLIREHTMTAAPRPGDRTKDESSPNWLPRCVPIPIRIIGQPGLQTMKVKVSDLKSQLNTQGVIVSAEEEGTLALSLPPRLEPDDGTTVVVTGAVVKRLGDLTEEDLVGCAPDCATPELVRWHLAQTYNSLPPGDDQLVTIWRWRYASLEEWQALNPE